MRTSQKALLPSRQDVACALSHMLPVHSRKMAWSRKKPRGQIPNLVLDKLPRCVPYLLPFTDTSGFRENRYFSKQPTKSGFNMHSECLAKRVSGDMMRARI